MSEMRSHCRVFNSDMIRTEFKRMILVSEKRGVWDGSVTRAEAGGSDKKLLQELGNEMKKA